MAFNTLNELMEAVEERRQTTLTLEIPINTPYSQEYEDAKAELQKAEGMKALTGGVNFLGGDQIEELKARVAELEPESDSVWVRFKRLPLREWTLLIRKQGLTPLDQYEQVLIDTFAGLWGVDPDPDEKPEFWEEPEPLTTDPQYVSSKGDLGILPGSALNSVVQTFINWQNAGGAISIRPTKSGRA